MSSTDPDPNPVPPPEPAAEHTSSHSRVFATQFQSDAGHHRATAASPSVGSGDELPSAFSLFKPSWTAVQRNLPGFIWLVVLPGLLIEVGSILTADFHKQYVSTGEVVSFIGGLYSVLVLAAVPLLSLRSAKGKSTNPAAVLQDSWRFFLRLLGLYIVIAVITLIGLVLLIVPGVIMIRRYFLAAYFLIDQDLSISEAMRRSAAASKGHSQAVFGVIGVEILLAIIGIIPLIGGILAVFFELPYSCGPALRYLELKKLAARPTTA